MGWLMLQLWPDGQRMSASMHVGIQMTNAVLCRMYVGIQMTNVVLQACMWAFR